MLELTGIRAGYESGEILHGLSFSVPPEAIVAVVGVNGAGKSTTLKVISGLLRPRAGEVRVDGRRLPGGSTEEAVRAGVAHVPEGRQVFPNMTVRENLLLGAYAARKAGTRGQRAQRARLEEAIGVFPELASRLSDYAGSLSGGQQQMLAIARGLMARPRLLMVDELSLGLAPRVVVDVLGSVLSACREQGVALLIVDQNLRALATNCDRVYVLSGGSTTCYEDAASRTDQFWRSVYF